MARLVPDDRECVLGYLNLAIQQGEDTDSKKFYPYCVERSIFLCVCIKLIRAHEI